MTPLRHLLGMIRSFIGWWLGELSGLVPDALRRPFRRVRPILLLEADDERVRFRLFRGQRCSDLGAVTLSTDDRGEETAEVAAITKRVDLRRSEIALRLPARIALRKSLTLPMAAQEDLRQAITFQLDQQTPFSPEEVCFDYLVAARSPAKQSMTIDLTVVPRQRVAAALDYAAHWGLQPDIVDVAGHDIDGPPRINLLDQNGADERRSWSRLNGVLAACAVVLLGLAVVVPLVKQKNVADGLQAELAVAKQRADAVMRIRDDIEALRDHNRFLIAEKERLPLRTLLLDDLTRLLPDGTWVTELRVNERNIRLVGFSSSAASLIGLIDEAPQFVAPRFRSSVKRDQTLGLETYSLSFETRERQDAP